MYHAYWLSARPVNVHAKAKAQSRAHASPKNAAAAAQKFVILTLTLTYSSDWKRFCLLVLFLMIFLLFKGVTAIILY